jgi:hypothetical protein
MRLSRAIVLGIPIILIFVAVVSAQRNTATVSGNVVDATGAVVPNAELRITPKKCKCEDCEHPESCDCCPNQLVVHSNDAGQYSFSVPHGIYRVDAKAGDREAHIEIDLTEDSAKTQNIRVQ